MKKIIPVILSTLLFGCSVIPRTDSATLYDLGPLSPLRMQQAGNLPALPPVSLADVTMPAWLDSTIMFYRLQYADEHQPRPYSQARWTMTPGQLLSQHLKSRIVQAGGVVLTTSDGALNVPVLRVEVDDFTQNFTLPGQSSGQVGLRASVFKERVLIAQKAFLKQVPAPSADAGGGAKALAAASDAVIADMIAWLGTLPLK